jgi:hypothetical protein
MTCGSQTSKDGSDALELKEALRPFDKSATGWLLGQAVRCLNAAGKEAEFDYGRVTENLRGCHRDLLETTQDIFRQVDGGDSSLRWSLLHVLGDVGDEKAADFLLRAALKPLPDKVEGEGCESGRDMEILVSTSAVHALHRVAKRHPQTTDHVLKMISERTPRPILVEAVKVAVELGHGERVRALLPQEYHWILEIRRARAQELFAEPEREDGKERGFTPPRSGEHYTAPQMCHCRTQEK